MSIHVSPFAASFAPRRGTQVSSSYPLAVAAPLAADTPDDGFSVRLGHMGVVVAISAPNAASPAAEANDTIRLEVEEEGFRRCADLFAGGHEASDGSDPVVRRLSRALEAAEHDGREFGGLYADALRLAIVTRLLSTPAPVDGETGCPPAAETRLGHSPFGRLDPAPVEEPATPSRRPKSGLPKWRFKRVAAYIDENLGESITLADMAQAAGLSRMHFAAQFRIATGVRPHEFLLRRRIERAQEMLLETRDPLVEIALAVGFQTQAHFTTVFRRFVGDTPYQWRCANCEAARA